MHTARDSKRPVESNQPAFEQLRLPMPPAGLGLVLRAAEDPESPLARLSLLVEAEPSLTAHVLKLANSAAFGVGKSVRSVAQATILLGSRAVRNMAVTQLMQVMVSRVDGNRFDVDSFWEQSLRRGAAALAIAELAGYEERSEAFSAGLIQDLGLLVMAVLRPDLALDLTAAMGSPMEVRMEREVALFGDTHASLFGRAARAWGVPVDLVEAIELHHETDLQGKELSRRTSRLTEILRVGDMVADVMGSPATFRRLASLQEALASLRTRTPIEPAVLIERVRTALAEMAAALSRTAAPQPSWEDLMGAAQKLLERITSEYEERTRKLEAELRERDRQTVTRRQKRAERGLTPIERPELVRRVARLIELAEAEGAPMSVVLILVQAPADTLTSTEWLESAVAVTRERLVAAVREEDVVFRVGRDELVAVLPGCARHDGPAVATRLCAKLTREFISVEGRAPSRIGILCTGTSVTTPEKVPAEEILRRAEVMRFQARSDRLDVVRWWG